MKDVISVKTSTQPDRSPDRPLPADSHRNVTTWLSCLLILCLVLPLAGCAGQKGPASWQSRQVEVRADQNDSLDVEAVIAYFQQSTAAFTVLENLLNDPELDLLEQQPQTVVTDVTHEEIAGYQALIIQYQTNLDTVLQDLAARTVPAQPELDSYQTAMIAELQLAIELAVEYGQILAYTDALMTMGENMDALSDVSTDDPEVMYQAFNDGLSAAVDTMLNLSVPSFLENTNNNLISALEQMNSAVLYSLNAVYINDPLRMDAAEYRLDILTRRFDTVVDGIDQDMTDRETKLNEDIARLQETQAGLHDWVDQNMDRLQGR